MIAVKNITRTYGSHKAVDNISFTVEKGEHIVFLGTSGSGKTTLLKMINRLIEPDAGEIRIEGRLVTEQRPEQLRGFDATMSDWGLLDARAALRWQREQLGPRLVLGHSFGGQLIGLLDELNEVDGMMLVGSQIGVLRTWS